MRMIIANRLTDGLVVFLTPDGGWSMDISDGAVLTEEADAEEKLAQAKSDETNCLVIDPNLIDVTLDNGLPKPVAIREAIRAFGPTV